MDMSYIIGMHPNLQRPIEAADPPPLQPTDQRQDLALEKHGSIVILQGDGEKDSGYWSV
jgi:hypothetical protein